VRAPRSGFAVVDDPAKRLVWVLGRRQSFGSATAYDSRTLAWRGRVLIPSWVNAAAAFGGRMWLASDAGVYVVSGPTGQPALVPGSYRYTYAVAADPLRNRVLAVTTGSPGQTYGINVTNLYVGRDDLVPTGRSSLAVVDGMAWVGGYGAARHITLINGPDRQPPLAVERKVNSGVVIWPGQNVLWMTFGGGVSCLDPRTGLSSRAGRKSRARSHRPTVSCMPPGRRGSSRRRVSSRSGCQLAAAADSGSHSQPSAAATIERASCWIWARWSGPRKDSA
jgi:hypothetical protein